MATSTKSALITGGASGMGLQVAKALSQRGGWHIHLLDLNEESGMQAAAGVKNATFHRVNVLDYDSLASVFQQVFDTEGRLDFVYANAGIVERFNFYEKHPAGKPPPPPDQTVVDINLKSVINTAWLAQHYFRQSNSSDDKNLVITGSSASIYPGQASPSYAGAKHGVVGFTRSIATFFYQNDNIRVNAICPGAIRTGLLDSKAWDTFKPEQFSPIEKVSEVVLMLIDGHDNGKGKVAGSLEAVDGSEKLVGKAIEISGANHYYRQQPEYCDAHMQWCMSAIKRETYAE